MNTIGELGDKMVAEDLQEVQQLWYPVSFAGRKGRSALDPVILCDTLRGPGGETKDAYGRDIHSAFNAVDPEIIVKILTDHRLHDLG